MARPTVLKICFVIAALSSIGIANSSYAALSAEISSSISIGGGTYSPSNKVTIKVSVGPTGCDPSLPQSTCQQYVAKSKHASGDRVFATNNADPKVYYKTVATTLTLEAPASATESFTATASWTAM